MDIKILDSWLREHLDTKAKPEEIARCLSLCGPSVEKTEKIKTGDKTDYLYSIEVTTNRVDMMSVMGIAREASVILPEFGIPAKLKKTGMDQGKINEPSVKMNFKNDPKLVYRIMAVVLEVDNLGVSPAIIKERLEASGIRSLNAAVDITNYVMTEVGHPTHVFDYDLVAPIIKVRESKKGETITSFDGVTKSLPGGDIVFENNKGEIIDLPGIIGTENSVVRESTNRILFFIDNNDPVRIRKTSMKLGIRTVAATLNEKGVDSELATLAMERGLFLFKKILKAKQVSKIYDLYTRKTVSKEISLKHDTVLKKLGIEIEPKKVVSILNNLEIKTTYNTKTKTYTSTPPTYRAMDMQIPEDIIEEIARIYGYHNFPSKLMSGHIPVETSSNSFALEMRIKEILKGLGGTELYTLSLVEKNEIKGTGLKLKNPLGAEGEYLRNNMMTSLVKAYQTNSGHREPLHLFELSNIYIPRKGDLPKEELRLAGVFSGYSYRKAKGIIEALLNELNITVEVEVEDAQDFKSSRRCIFKSSGQLLGELGVLENDLIYYDFQVDKLFTYSREFSSFKILSKYPPQVEDMTLEFPSKTKISDVIKHIKESSNLIGNVELNEIYNDSLTFRIQYQSMEKTLTNSEVKNIRDEVLKRLSKSFSATVK